MSSGRTRASVFVVVGFVCLWLTGCLGGSKQSTFYVLQPATQAPVADAPGSSLAIVVGPLRLPAFLDRQQLVTRERGNQIRIHEFNRWGGTFRSEILRALVGNLGALLETDRIVAYPISPPWRSGYRLVLDVERFEGERGEQLVLDVLWSIVPHEGGEGLVVDRTDIRESLGSSSYEALVAAHDEALAKLSAEIAQAFAALASEAASPD